MSIKVASSSVPIKKYLRTDFDKIKNEGFIYVLPQDTIETIKSISLKVGAPEYIKTPHFEKRKQPHQLRIQIGMNENEWVAARKLKKTVFEKKEGINASIDRIRKHLNKMTDKTYDTLKETIIKEIEFIISEGSNSENGEDSCKDSSLNTMTIEKTNSELIEELNKVGDVFFTIASGNRFFSSMYAKLYKELMLKYDFMNKIFITNLNTFSYIFKDFNYCDPNKDYDEFCKNNKDNEKRRSLCLFYINLMLQDVIPCERIIGLLQDMQAYLIESIQKPNNTNISDEISEIIYMIITNSSIKLSKQEKTWTNIIRNVNKITLIKLKTEPSISNKTIFKHMDILDFINKK